MCKFILVGGYAGKTINLGGHDFIEGVFDYTTYIDGDGKTIATSPTDQALKADYLAKSYQAYREGSAELKEAQERLDGGAKLSPGISVEQREQEEQQRAGEQQSSTRQQAGALRSAILKLDPAVDAHWTTAGLPSVEAVRDLSGQADVSRADIQALAPKLTREEAKKAAGERDPLDQ